MGAAFSALWAAWFPAGADYKLVLVGLDNAGKTTTLYRLHLGETVRTTPTVGSNVESVTAGNLKFECWDLGGQVALRPSWALYYEGADAVLLVVDAADRARVGAARAELHALIAAPALARVPLAVLANKQDKADAMPAAELGAALGLPELAGRNAAIFAVAAVRGEGLQEAMAWVAEQVRLRRLGGA
jgi:small GTP-binding protein